MKKLSIKTLHQNFILIYDFVEESPMKSWVRKDKTYCGHYHDDWNALMEVVQKIGDKTGYELVSGYSYSYWNNMGDTIGDGDFGGYENIVNIYKSVVNFITNYKATNS